MKLIAFILTTILSSILIHPVSGELSKGDAKPNILLFFIDDLGYSDISVNGSEFYETPNIDQLAKNGVNFTNSYSAHPVCSPTRASLMTGKAPQRVGITQWIPQPSNVHLPLAETTIAEALKAGGYSTGYIGKWHLGEKDNQLPSNQGFDWTKAVNRAGQPASYHHPYTNQRKGGYWNVPDMENSRKGDYLTDGLTDHAIDFINQTQDTGKPFLLTFSHYAVHTPIQAPEKLIRKYQAKRKKLYGDTKTPFTEDRYGTWARARQDHVKYAAMLENLDTNIGRIITHLEKRNLLENTLVIFTSDNGGHCHLRGKHGVASNAPLRSGKGWNYEGGIRIPTIFHWKGKLTPRTIDTPTITMDLYPTLLEIAGLPLKPEQHLDGTSISTLLHGQTSKELQKRFIAWTYPHNHGSGHKPSSAIRQGHFKLIRFQEGKRFELYNLNDDPSETTNLADKDLKTTQRLNLLLTGWLTETNKTP